MRVIKKINNNVAIALDGNNHEIVVFGKGIGFTKPPYELTDYSQIEQTFYNIDRRFYDLFADLDAKVLLLTSKLVEKIQMQSTEKWSPNLTIILADHIQFALEREKAGMVIDLPYLSEIEESEPRIMAYALWIVKNINHHFHTKLPRGEISCIAMHLMNSRLGQPKTNTESLEEKRSRILRSVIAIIERNFDLHINRKDSSYYRFRQHIHYFVQRKESSSELTGQNHELFEMMGRQHPAIYDCVSQINDYLYQEYQSNCSEDELLYLMIHINRLITQNQAAASDPKQSSQ